MRLPGKALISITAMLTPSCCWFSSAENVERVLRAKGTKQDVEAGTIRTRNIRGGVHRGAPDRMNDESMIMGQDDFGEAETKGDQFDVGKLNMQKFPDRHRSLSTDDVNEFLSIGVSFATGDGLSSIPGFEARDFCPRFQDDPKYFVDMLLLASAGYQEFFGFYSQLAGRLPFPGKKK